MSIEHLPRLIDEPSLTRFLDDRLPGTGPFEIRRHQAGHSNETFFVSRGGHEWVLRRPPLGAFLPTAHDVGREHRVLAALAPTPVRSPAPLVYCDDPAVIGAPFYVMERVEGVVLRDRLPDAYGAADRIAIGDELVGALVELHSLEPEACGLGDLGKPTGYLSRQLRRWQGQLELTLPMTRPLPALMAIGSFLAAERPASQRTVVVHGDYKLDNVVFSREPPARLVAILDWEMSTLGDPLADLGWMISFWREPGDEEGPVDDLPTVTTLDGFRTRAALLETYAVETGLDVSGIDWYVVLALWKLAILLEGSYARHLAGMTDDPFFSRMETLVPALAERALAIAGL